MKPSTRRQNILLPSILFAALPILLGACTEAHYYWQAAWGQGRILAARISLEQALAANATPQAVQRKLRLIQRAQGFAATDLAIPEREHYRHYVALGRPQVSWLVVAAEPFRLRAREFCYPVVGCLEYRGYFKRTDADTLAKKLEHEGLDVVVRAVRAYSTLGWFADPILDTMLQGTEEQIVATLFHELAHRMYFLAGDTAFNESLASFVEQEGLRRFAQKGDAEWSWERYEQSTADQERFRTLVRQTKAQLEALYASSLPEAEKRVRKLQAFQELRAHYTKQRAEFQILNYDRWFAQTLNNAHLLGFSQYTVWVPAFAALFRQSEGRFETFYEAVRTLGQLPAEDRRARMSSLRDAELLKTRSAF